MVAAVRAVCKAGVMECQALQAGRLHVRGGRFAQQRGVAAVWEACVVLRVQAGHHPPMPARLAPPLGRQALLPACRPVQRLRVTPVSAICPTAAVHTCTFATLKAYDPHPGRSTARIFTWQPKDTKPSS